MGPPAGSRPKDKERKREEKPKIRNLRRYRIGGWTLGPPAGSRPKAKGKREREESQKSEI